ncbi:NmrA family NAD(P)-binding protein [Plantactinospora sp. GCM10030261]|uniref:NmrA family NAD(P)-binding protein n=1 Tax=Plantactinospora sp. GCM10030261 TaxID=3273420 RepID=UPI00360D1514
MTYTDRRVVAVHGATGTQGETVIRALAVAGYRVRALARRPGTDRPGANLSGLGTGEVGASGVGAGKARITEAGVIDAVPADLDDPESLVLAYSEVDAVVVHLPIVFAAERAVPQAEAVLTALARAGVRRVVVNPGTLLPPVEIGVPFVDARVRLIHRLADGPFASSVVAPGAQYAENLNAPWSAARILADGVLAYPLPEDLPVPWVALDDIGAIVAETLAQSSPQPLTVVSGPTALTGPETAEVLGSALGRRVRWETISGEEYRKMLVPHLGDEAAAGIGAMYGAILSGQAPPPPVPDQAVLRTGTTTVARWAAGKAWTGR